MMLKISTLFAASLAAAFSVPSFASPPVSPSAQSTPAPAAKAKYSTADTEIGKLLDDPAAKAIVEKHIPGFTTNDQIDMARGMTLKVVQQYAGDDVTDARLVAIDADLAKLK